MTVATAPGKAILFGEHAVVYGRPAIAVPIPQVRATAEVTDIRGAAPGQVSIEAPDIGFNAWLEHAPGGHPLAALVRLCLETLGLRDFPSLRLRVTSGIPVASGLGSGAAVSIAAARALGSHLGHPFPTAQLSDFAFEIDRIHHGTPSGIDNTVIAFEQPVRYVKGESPTLFDIATPFHLLIVDSGQRSSTALAVGKVRERWQRKRDRFEALFDAIGVTAESAHAAILNGRIHDLGPLMDHNQALLEALGVSTAELERLIAAARNAGAAGAKLSGAGLGGNILALVEPARMDAVEQAVTRQGAVRCLRTEVRA